jgi:hypothetical protein
MSGDTGTATVVKLSRNGRLVWKALLAGDGSLATSVALDAAGDVFVAAYEGGLDESYAGYFTAIKLSGATGAVLWKFAVPTSVSGALRVDPAGDAIASFVEPGPEFEDIVTCVKLAGNDGGERWRNSTCGNVLAVDRNGDVVVDRFATVQKLDGTTGDAVWARPLGVAIRTSVVDPRGDVVVVGHTTTAKLSAATGAILWTIADPTLYSFQLGIIDVAADAAGDVVLVGMTDFVPQAGSDFVVVKRASGDGAERWRTSFTGVSIGFDVARAVEIDAKGDVIATGTLSGLETGGVCLIVRLQGATGRTRWTRELRGTGRWCEALALDARGNFAVAGSTLAPKGDLFGSSATFVVARGTGRSGQGLRPVRILP